MHVYGPQSRFPFAADRTFTPGDAPKEALFALHARLGITRCVIVQSSAHGFDNQVVADALAAKAGAYRGVALVQPNIADAALRALDEQGFRGVRFNYMRHLGRQAPMAEVLALAGRLASPGWHLQIHLDPALLPDLAPTLLKSPVPVVIDHMARIPADPGQQNPHFAHLCRLLDTGRCWVKVSGADRASLQGPPYADAVPMGRRLVADYPDQVLWGTDWPHPNHAGPVPDDGALVDLLAGIAPTPAARQALLVDNPQRLYRFSN